MRRDPLLWAARVVWALQPVTMGSALSDAIADWGDGPRATAAVLVWAAWVVGLIGVLRPSPAGLTVARTGSGLALVVAAIVAFGDVSTGAAALGLAGAALALAVVAQPGFADRCIDAASYGDERRFCLRMPPALMLGPVPVAVLVVGAGIASGPLLLADRRWIAGAVVTVVGATLAVGASRSLHSLAQRFVVLVPNGLAIHDPTGLGDTTLFLRQVILRLGPADLHDTGTDLRAGAVSGALLLELREPLRLLRSTGRRRSEVTETDRILFTPTLAGTLLARAGERKITVA